ncbi:MAG: hypothetical protein HDS13_04190 [Bacteroides sp.]|nr:hypothetical protein [Bacteroides sp.]
MSFIRSALSAVTPYNIRQNTVFSAFTLILLVSSVIFTSCQHDTEMRRSLTTAENIMDEYPDSALKIIEAMTPAEMSEADRALYAILRLQALDKLHCQLPQDSLITDAIRFYSHTDNPLRLLIANYYRGRELYMNDNPTEAIRHFYKAKEIAEQQGLHFWAGMSCRGIADIYNESYNTVEELNFARQEYDHIKKSGRQPYINYAALDLARACISNNIYDEAMKLCQTMLDSAAINEDDILRYSALRYIALTNIRQDYFSQALPLYQELCQSAFAEQDDSLCLSLSLTGIGKHMEASAVLDNVDINNNLKGHYVRQQILSNTGNYQQAFYESKLIDMLSYNALNKRIHNGLISAVSNHLEAEKDLADTNASAAIVRLRLTIVISILILTVVILVSILLYQRQQKYKERNLQAAHEFETLLQHNREKSLHTSAVLKKVLGSHQNVISDLNNVLNQYGSTNSISEKLLNTVTRIIDNFSIDGDSVKLLETQVNETYDNVITDLYTDLPKMKEADYRLFLFSLLGFSIPAIAVFLKEKKITAVYDRKRRLKDKIKTLDPIKSNRYLAFLN